MNAKMLTCLFCLLYSVSIIGCQSSGTFGYYGQPMISSDPGSANITTTFTDLTNTDNQFVVANVESPSDNLTILGYEFYSLNYGYTVFSVK